MEGGTTSVRGVRDHTHAIAASQGELNSTESQTAFMCPVCPRWGAGGYKSCCEPVPFRYRLGETTAPSSYPRTEEGELEAGGRN